MFDPQEIRKEFPILNQTVYGKPLIYLDNAATTQKPQCVIDAISNAYLTINANVHRGVHHLSQVATEEFEKARHTVQQYIGATHSHEIIFTRGTTESINLVATSFGNTFLKKGDEVTVISAFTFNGGSYYLIDCEQGQGFVLAGEITDRLISGPSALTSNTGTVTGTDYTVMAIVIILISGAIYATTLALILLKKQSIKL